MRGKNIFCTGPTSLEQPRQNKNLLYRRNKPSEGTKKEPLSFVLFGTSFTQFQQSVVATLLYILSVKDNLAVCWPFICGRNRPGAMSVSFSFHFFKLQMLENIQYIQSARRISINYVEFIFTVKNNLHLYVKRVFFYMRRISLLSRR